MGALTRVTDVLLEWAMSESVSVRCPACRREHRYAAPSYPCVCGAPVVPPLDRHVRAAPVVHRVWQEEWVTVRCGACGRSAEWPRPELGCPCGTVLCIPVAGTDAGASAGTAGTTPAARRPEAAGPAGRRPAPRPRPVRGARDVVTATVLYLRSLGYRDVRRAEQRPASGIGLAAPGFLAQVDPTGRRASVRDVECLWLTAMTESVACAHFALAGPAEDARARADLLGVPLFVLDTTGPPRPVNSPADALHATGA